MNVPVSWDKNGSTSSTNYETDGFTECQEVQAIAGPLILLYAMSYMLASVTTCV